MAKPWWKPCFFRVFSHERGPGALRISFLKYSFWILVARQLTEVQRTTKSLRLLSDKKTCASTCTSLFADRHMIVVETEKKKKVSLFRRPGNNVVCIQAASRTFRLSYNLCPVISGWAATRHEHSRIKYYGNSGPNCTKRVTWPHFHHWHSTA